MNDDEPTPDIEVRRDEIHAYEQWVDLGFDPVEALSLVAQGLSASLVREFSRHHACDTRIAVQILL